MARLLKNWLEGYMEYSQHSESPDRFHKWTGIAVIAGALRRRVFIDMGYFKWRPNFFIFFVAPAGIVSKGTTVDIGISLLREVEGINFGPEALTWQALVQGLTKAQESFDTDEMYEGEPLKETMSAMTIVASELGTFLDPDDRAMIDALVSLYDCKDSGPWEKWTKSDGQEKIINPWINLIGCTTPTWISQHFNEHFIMGGFASRSIFLFADAKRKLVSYPSRHIGKDFELQREVLINDLRLIAELQGVYTITEDCYIWGEEWYEKHYYEQPEHLQNEKYRGYLARKQAHMHKLAMVLSASVGDDLVITREILELAGEEMAEVEKYMPKVFGEIGQTAQQSLAIEIFYYILPHGCLNRDEVYRHFFRVMNFDEFEVCLRTLIHTNMIVLANRGSTIYLEITDYARDYVEKSKKGVEAKPNKLEKDDG